MGWQDAPVVGEAQPGWMAAPLVNPETSGVAARALKNVPRSAGNFVGGIVTAIRHPADTAGALVDVATGAVQKALPESMQAVSAAPQREMAGAVGDYFKQRYGGFDKATESFASDPVGVAADIASIFTGGAGAAAKVPILAKAAGVVGAVGRVVDPINAAGKVLGPVVKFAGNRAADLVGNLATHTGGESVRQAFRSGVAGGEAAKAFTENMRGGAPMADVVDQAREALGNMRAQRSQAYRSGMVDISKDKTVLDMQPVMDAFNSQREMGTYKGKVIKGSTVETQDKIGALLDDWAKSDPAEYHTPEGLDALKQAIGDVREGTEFGSAARKAADNAYNAVKTQITKQAPAYAKVMKDYEQASDALKEVERSLSLGPKATNDTALRKLQSLLRNNVNTNYGNRLEAARALEQSGAPNLRPALAGQSLNTWTPRGLQNLGTTGLSAGLVSHFLGVPYALPMLAAQSPRLVGEAAHLLGRGVNRLADPLGAAASPTSLSLYEANQLNQGENFLLPQRNYLAGSHK